LFLLLTVDLIHRLHQSVFMVDINTPWRCSFSSSRPSPIQSLHTPWVRKKLGHFYFYCNFGKCWSIL